MVVDIEELERRIDDVRVMAEDALDKLPLRSTTTPGASRERHIHDLGKHPGGVIAARVFNSAAITGIVTATETALTFDSERFDTDTIHSTSSNTGRLTATTAGKYLISGVAHWSAAVSANVQIVIRLNGSTRIARSIIVGTDYRAMHVSTIYDLAATDYVELLVRHGSGSDRTIAAISNESPEFMMARVGAAGTTGGGTPGTDHGSLTGLSDDDHSQYLLAAGTRALTADWDAGGFDIKFEDNKGIILGTGDDAKISYDGTDLVIDAQVAGTGVVKIADDLQVGTEVGISTAPVLGTLLGLDKNYGGNIDPVTGIKVVVAYGGTSSVSDMRGIDITAHWTAGVGFTTMVGGRFRTSTQGATAAGTNIVGIRIDQPDLSSSNTPSNIYGLQILDQCRVAAGGDTYQILLKAGSTAGLGDNFGIFQDNLDTISGQNVIGAKTAFRVAGAKTFTSGFDVFVGAGLEVSSATIQQGAIRINGTFYIGEQADAHTDVDGFGQIWVNTATPNELWFTDDAGTDVQLGVTLSHGESGHTGDIIPDADQAFTGDLGVTGAITATSYGGITEANLLDKSATETVSGAYTFSDATSVIGGVTASNLVDKSATESISGAWTHIVPLVVDGTTDAVQLKVQAHSTQTANVVEFEQSDGTNILKISNAGVLETLSHLQTGAALKALGTSPRESRLFMHKTLHYMGFRAFTTGTGKLEIHFQSEDSVSQLEYWWILADGEFQGQGARSITTTSGDLTLNPSGGVVISSDLTFGDTMDIIFNTSTGTKIGTATTQKLGFYGVSPVVQQTALTSQDTSLTHTAPGTPDFAIQDLTQTTPFGFVTKDEGNTVLQVILNLQTRVAEVETKLQSLGLLA